MVSTIVPPESQLGPYRVIRRLGEGGMGVVYLGEDPQNGQRVALKLLLQQNRKDKSTALIEEALTARRIDHPNCVAVYGVFDGPGETPVVVSEFVDGINAREFFDQALFKRRPGHSNSFSALAALLILEQMFRGLRAAHKIGITHQDIKPQNYIVSNEMVQQIQELVGQDGVLHDQHLEQLLWLNRELAWIKLCDWGLALFHRKRPVAKRSVSITHTRIQQDKRGGTLVYMPIEQIEGIGVSRRTDIFPLGLILYEMLSGHSAIEARCHSEGLTKSSFGDYFQFLMKVAASKIRSVVIARTDPKLDHVKEQRLLMRLLESMTARQKQHRISSNELEVKLDQYIACLHKDPRGLLGTSPLWSIMLALVVIIGFGGLFYSYQPAPTRAISVEVDRDMRAGKFEAIPTLTSLDPKLAELCIQSGLPALNFASVVVLDLESAQILAQFKGSRLSFPRVRFLNPEVAMAIAQSQVSELAFDGLERLELPVAGGLAPFKGGVLSLNGMKSIEYSEAVAMSALSCITLKLNGLEQLRHDYARELIRYEGREIELNKIQRLDLETATVLGSFNGERINLRGLEYLDARVAKELSLFRGVIYLDGLRYARSAALRILQQNLQTFKVSESIRKRFTRLNRTNQLLQQTQLTAKDARRLVNDGYPQLTFAYLRTLNPGTAKEIAKFEGSALHFHKLTSLTPEVARELVKCPVERLCLTGLLAVEDLTSHVLSQSRQSQLFLGVRTLSTESALELAQFKGSVLRFSRLLQLDLETLKALTKYRGTELYLGLGRLTSQYARLAATSKVSNTLGFDNLTTLDIESARELVRYPGARLSLQGLRNINGALRRVLRDYPGDVIIAGHQILK
jgi:serine/threonine protein kinase